MRIIMWACHPEHVNEENFQPTLTSSEFQKHPWQSTAAVQHNEVNLATLICIGMPVFAPFNLRHRRGYKSSTFLRGILYSEYILLFMYVW